MLYPRTSDKTLDPALFADPTSEYRCTPFWAWNCDLKTDLLLREIGYMKEMGMGGFHMHVRTGMSTRYLSDEFMARIRECVDEAKKQHMLAWLYDEDKWPSGFAGGFVTEKPENRQKHLLLTPFSYEDVKSGKVDKAALSGVRTGNGVLLARYSVELDDRGCLRAYKRLGPDEQAAGQVWYAYLETVTGTPWFHFNGYSDTMSSAAVNDFIRITHERYKETVGDEFGKTCPAIFCDEPQMTRKVMLAHATDLADVILPFTSDFEDTYVKAYGVSLLDHLPEAVWELPEGVSLIRYHFHDHAAERFAGAFCDIIGKWCKDNGILMTGHMMSEPTLDSQANAVGECMRAYRSFTLPGIDMLCGHYEFNTAKQAASAAHQQGCPGVMSELYGVTNWDYDFRGHKIQGDWQAALGITVRVPHLYWVSMHGESKRDYPASIGHQSAWYKEYPFIEDHYARVNTAMTRGKARIRIGVIHPIESLWLTFGPTDQTGVERAELDRRFSELTEWLLYNTLDFDFICESTLPKMHTPGGKAFNVGKMAYDIVIVPGCKTLRRTTADALMAFLKSGGHVLFMGEAPAYIDGIPSVDGARLCNAGAHIPWRLDLLLKALKPFRDVTVHDDESMPSDNIFCAIRSDGETRYAFLCHVRPAPKDKIEREERYTVTFTGEWAVRLLDTSDGSVSCLPAAYKNACTEIVWDCYPQDSLLLELRPGRNAEQYAAPVARPLSEAAETLLPDPAEIILHEDNVCLADMAEWRIDDGEWQPKEEMLRIGVAAKKALGMSTATVGGAQPWILPDEAPEHTVSLRTEFLSDIELDHAFLALEDFTTSEITFNGRPLPKESRGYFVDESITRVRVGPVLKGRNVVTVTKPFTVRSNIENMFLLGNFGVRVTGREIRIIPAPERLYFGDWTSQGLPFYGGPLTYRFRIRGGKPTKLRLGLFSAPCAVVELDGKRIANVSLAPFEADLGTPAPGEHVLDIKVFASRINTFGTFHLNDYRLTWFGPGAWRSTGMDWTYEYRIAPTGLLSEPHLYTF